jgi:hypothetical protein
VVRQQQFIGENADLLADLRIFFIAATFSYLIEFKYCRTPFDLQQLAGGSIIFQL